jgi:hypothetical protein
MNDFSQQELTKLHAVARIFRCELIPEENGWRCRLPICEAFSLIVRLDFRSSKKAIISPTLPVGISACERLDSIRLSLHRPALAITKDIQRRLIPAATAWAQKSRDLTAKRLREKQTEAEFLASIFAANRCEPTRWSHRESWTGKGLEIDRYNAQFSYRGEHVATVKVRSLQALQQIAAICAEDYEFHERRTAAKAKEED